MLVHWIWLSTRPGLNDRAKRSVLRHFHDPEDAYFAPADAYSAVEELTPEAVDALRDKNLLAAEEILQQCTDKNLHILTYQDAAYPARLKNISDPPVVLYYKGRLPDFDGEPLIGVVGTRKASVYGMSIAKRMGYQIARCGGIVVSGLAYGIDGMAMRGALSAGKPVVGILGSGADVVYPLSNRALFADVQQHGCLLSEFPPGTPPLKWNFPKRNRIISGLSCGVLVVEAPEKSGALITAHQAADQGRDVFVVPGNIDVATSAGSNALLRDGAIAVGSGWDILSEYAALFPGKIHRETGAGRLTAYPEEVQQAAQAPETERLQVAQKPRRPGKKAADSTLKEKKSIDNGASAPYIDLNEQIQSLSPDERTVTELLRDGERLVDDLIAASGLTAGAVLASLTLLEVKGIITRKPGKWICLTGRKP